MFDNDQFECWLNQQSDKAMEKLGSQKKLESDEMMVLMLKAQTNHICHLERDLHGEIKKVRTDLGSEIEEVRTDLRDEIKEVRTDLGNEIGKVRTDLGSVVIRVTSLQTVVSRLNIMMGSTIVVGGVALGYIMMLLNTIIGMK